VYKVNTANKAEIFANKANRSAELTTTSTNIKIIKHAKYIR